jgi:hypothetical protein
MTQTASPWQPPPGSPALMWQALHAASRTDPSLPTASAIMAAVDLAYDLAFASGMIHASPDPDREPAIARRSNGTTSRQRAGAAPDPNAARAIRLGPPAGHELSR